MTKMLTLFGKDISKMSFNELKRERHVQSFLLTRMRYIAKDCKKQNEKYKDSSYYSTIREDKTLFFDAYVRHLEALIAEIDYWMDRRYEPESNSGGYKTKAKIREENAKRRQLYLNDNNARWDAAQSQDGLHIVWDKEKFDLVAADRGYQTEETVVSVVGEELHLDRTRAKMVVDSGRFTWGQVLCLGAFLQMTPKEFCDVFLAGYFVERYGEYRAEYGNLDKTQLLKRAIKPNRSNQ